MIPYADNKFSALNTAVWSGGSFIYVPKEHTSRCLCKHTSASTRKIRSILKESLIIADEGSSIHYVEGCTAPTYSTDSLHWRSWNQLRWRVLKSATLLFRTGLPMSTTCYQARHRSQNAVVEWVDGNIGSKLYHEVSCSHSQRRRSLLKSSPGSCR